MRLISAGWRSATQPRVKRVACNAGPLELPVSSCSYSASTRRGISSQAVRGSRIPPAPGDLKIVLHIDGQRIRQGRAASWPPPAPPSTSISRWNTRFCRAICALPAPRRRGCSRSGAPLGRRRGLGRRQSFQVLGQFLGGVEHHCLGADRGGCFQQRRTAAPARTAG